MVMVTWYGACYYANALSRAHGLTPCYELDVLTLECDFTADGYRLPRRRRTARPASRRT